MKKLYLIMQSYGENKGSFYGFAEEFAKYAMKRGYKVIIICAKQHSKEPDFEDLGYANVRRFSLFRFPLFNTIVSELQFAKKLKQYFKKNHESPGDLILANGFTPLGIPNKRYVLRSPDQPAITLIKSFEIAKKEASLLTRLARLVHFGLYYFFDNAVAKHACGIVYSSGMNRKECIKYYHVDKIPYLIPNKAVDFEKIEKGKDVRLTGKNILFIARSDERIRKGVIHFEKALPFVFDKYKDLKVIHIGDETSWKIDDKYKKRIVSIGKIPQDEICGYYKSVDLIALCSLSEGIPAVLMEAMAAGTPILTSDMEGAEEYIKHKRSGYVYRRGDIEGLKNGLAFMLEDKKRAKDMGEIAKKAAKSFDSKTYYPTLLKFIEDVSNKKKPDINLLS